MSRKHSRRNAVTDRRQRYWDIEEFHMIDSIRKRSQETGKFYVLEEYWDTIGISNDMDYRYVDRFIRQFCEVFDIPLDAIYYKEEDFKNKGFTRCYFMGYISFLADIDGEITEIVCATRDYYFRNKIYDFIRNEGNGEFCRRFYYSDIDKGFIIRRKWKLF